MAFSRSDKARSIGCALALGWIALSAPVGSAFAQAGNYPAKPVTIVVAFPPGGMTDIVSRALAKELSQNLKQPFIIDNRPGVAGQVGTEYVAKQHADGYTLLVGATGYVIAPAMKKVGYDPLKSLEPVAVLAKSPNLIVVNPKVPAKTLPEFLAWAKTQSNIPFGTAGAAGSTHLGGEWLRTLTGYAFVHVPYKGAAPATNDAVAGQIPMAVQDSMSVSSFITTGRLRPIATMSAERSKLFPDLPTMQEAGFKGFDVYTWLGLYAPAGTPAPIVTMLNKEINKIMNSPEMVERLRLQYSEPLGVMDLAQTRKFVEGEVNKWKAVVQQTGVKADD
ncbi:tripartite tricarboxylate transporter substrate binding protein [Diaphorobacter sp. HDW4A]|uniref:Bug family tripartite tricarboxylate transporter substrate binding protein n=1 Tax=Diaphorobacter sp. HDW4A TaxID=2714924 RepID=UPI0014083BFB|nr:tripartite tricarboxylate transporter substrate binding protein [Diaphorobacter sp. HDW4A]QIL79909.1 tripartite tricarboxylate transporter substrate binding protein [Diaphorobacter sp. HDW4A]